MIKLAIGEISFTWPRSNPMDSNLVRRSNALIQSTFLIVFKLRFENVCRPRRRIKVSTDIAICEVRARLEWLDFGNHIFRINGRSSCWSWVKRHRLDMSIPAGSKEVRLAAIANPAILMVSVFRESN